MQLFDGTEVKAYRLRKDDGGSDRWSAVYWIDRKGNTESVYADRFSWVEQEEWTSPKTGLTYPTHVKIEVDHPQKGKLIYLIEPLIENQEFYGLQEDNAYWEGACRVIDNEGRIIGRAYLELAGYGGGLGARLN
jgi:predicted secreted hydrolase